MHWPWMWALCRSGQGRSWSLMMHLVQRMRVACARINVFVISHLSILLCLITTASKLNGRVCCVTCVILWKMYVSMPLSYFCCSASLITFQCYTMYGQAHMHKTNVLDKLFAILTNEEESAEMLTRATQVLCETTQTYQHVQFDFVAQCL